MTYTTTSIFTLPQGITINNEAEWIAEMNNHFTITPHSTIRADRSADPLYLSENWSFDGDTVTRISSWTNLEASMAFRSGKHAEALVGIYSSMKKANIVSSFSSSA